MNLADPLSPFILPFAAPGLALENAGGKGANLARLAAAGYPVPTGFIITTAGYQAFVANNGLDESIRRILAAHNLTDLTELETASAEIRQAFTDGAIPSELAEQILLAYRALGPSPVAVRSSATAEDLPDLSFAGQQETFLNIINEAALLKAVVSCWSSLWTGRAMGYRIRQGIGQQGLGLAVVVQQMVPSEVSGVMFTANPLSGLRGQVVIDATFGLGEALVSGQVEPDHYVVDAASGTILDKRLGSKAMSIRPRREGGTSAGLEDAANRQALPDAQILELAGLGQRVAADYDFPQDIEWAWAGGRLYLLQSRPVTSLFPLPVRPLGEPLEVYFSFGAVQGLLDPMTPLGRDALAEVFAFAAGLFGYQRTTETQSVIYEAGERLWIRVTPILCNSFGRKAAAYALALVEPSILQAVKAIQDDPRLLPDHQGTSFGALFHLAQFFPRLAWNVLRNLAAPEKRRQFIVDNGERVLADLRRRSQAVQGDRHARLLQRVTLLADAAAQDLPRSLILFVSGVASGMAPFNLLNNLSKQLPRDPQAAASRGWDDLALEITRGLPHNPTTEMDLMLW
ncbi:MAG TPA: PEP/pyruvate-binding domain-containing protein, partial [Polyangia bacterium]